ncbi:MAG: DUF4249 domain-containing protein [Bacteroidetes bacterium]|nr:DUF4249 domain-containing protein [Bacteroidota bacterium]
MRKTHHFLWLLLFLAICCKEKFTPNLNSPTTGYLVVEGIINGGNGSTNINLSRTIKLDSTLQHELGAIVQVEGNDNTTYTLTEKGNGLYQIDLLNLNSANKYRLHIYTSNNNEYISDFVDVKDTPPIDTVAWTYDGDGVHITANTHDPNNNSKYYYWNYEETWEYNAPFIPELKTVDTIINFNEGHTFMVVPWPADPSVHTCWNTQLSSQILIGSSAKLSEDIIENAPVTFVPKGSLKLSKMYSILVKQYALTADAYAFLNIMKKNTEQTGSVFDPQPSELKGNIHSVKDPSEIVVGYVSAAKEQTKRIFISNSQVQNWNYQTACQEDTVDPAITPIRQWVASGYVPVHILSKHDGIIYNGVQTVIVDTYTITLPQCVDCTLTGTNIKPSFWP